MQLQELSLAILGAGGLIPHAGTLVMTLMSSIRPKDAMQSGESLQCKCCLTY